MPKSKISLMKKRLTCRPHRDCGIAHQMLLRHGQCVAFVPVVIRVWRLDAFVHTHYDVIRES